jgi:hypothetical protein
MRFRGPRLSRSFTTSFALALFVALAAVPAVARHATPTPTASPSLPPEDPAITTIARREFVQWQAGTVDKSHYAAPTQAKLTTEKISDTAAALAGLGSLQSVEWNGSLSEDSAPPGTKGYLYRMICVSGAVYEELTIGPDGKIDGIFFRDKLQ